MYRRRNPRRQQYLEELRARTPDPVTGRLPLDRYRFSDVPILELEDLDYISASSLFEYDVPTPEKTAFKAACQAGSASAVRALISATSPAAPPPPTPARLHHGLVLALYAGNVAAAETLLDAGAPIVRETASVVLDRTETTAMAAHDGGCGDDGPPHPDDDEVQHTQIALLALLLRHGWNPNEGGRHGQTLVSRAACGRRRPLLRWLLTAAHADPNLDQFTTVSNDQFNRAPARVGRALEIASRACESGSGGGGLETVQLLLDAGADASLGHPLYFAAGAMPPGAHMPPVRPSRAFDLSCLPVMERLVQAGADVNKKYESLHVVPEYPIVAAVMAGAVERVRWLLAHGADARLPRRAQFQYGNALEEAQKHGSDEMKQLLAAWEREHPEKAEEAEEAEEAEKAGEAVEVEKAEEKKGKQ